MRVDGRVQLALGSRRLLVLSLVLALRVSPVAGASSNGAATKPALAGRAPLTLSRVRSSLRLYKAWQRIYNLTQEGTLPKEPLQDSHFEDGNSRWLPPAPHLQDCVAEDEQHRRQELRGDNGSPPPWIMEDRSKSRPPWVFGDDGDNLAKTRQAQADIWLHQFPVNCSDSSLKFVVADWMAYNAHGIGSQIHVMSSSFGIAIRYKRILVPSPGTFTRASHTGCSGDAHGSLSCYFLPVTSKECQDQALLLSKTQETKDVPGGLHELLLSDRPVVWFTQNQIDFHMEGHAARLWGEPWTERPYTFEVSGHVPKEHSDLHIMTNWWFSQAVRFMLRWPSPYLCHISNRVRHEAFGRAIALQVHDAQVVQASLAKKDWLEAVGGNNITEHWASDSFEQTLWHSRQPLMPRPMLSIHVRQGDKAPEMKLLPFEAYMWQAERLRQQIPGLKRIWLSTEMESVVSESSSFHRWSFFYSHLPRQVGATPFFQYESSVGFEAIVGTSFANLLIAAECDHFIGTLGSNWNRLINELRLTNGRLAAGYISLNEFYEW